MAGPTAVFPLETRQGANRADTRRVRRAAARRGAPVTREGVDFPPACRRQRGLVRLRATCPAGASHVRRGARRHPGPLPVLAGAFTRAGQRAALRGHHGEVWARQDVMPARLRAAVLLGAFAGLRSAEACGLRVADVDFMRGVIPPQVQYPAEPLKTDTSRTAVPIAASMPLELSAHVGRWPGETAPA